jgi:hypothetical protein
MKPWLSDHHMQLDESVAAGFVVAVVAAVDPAGSRGGKGSRAQALGGPQERARDG